MTKTLALAGLATILAVGSTSTLACSCADPPPPLEATTEASTVFSGTVVSIDSEELRKKVLFEVIESWKGDVGPRLEIYTALDGAMCGFTFEEGKRYLVYSASDDPLTTDICTRTRALEEAADDLEALRNAPR